MGNSLVSGRVTSFSLTFLSLYKRICHEDLRICITSLLPSKARCRFSNCRHDKFMTWLRGFLVTGNGTYNVIDYIYIWLVVKMLVPEFGPITPFTLGPAL